MSELVGFCWVNKDTPGIPATCPGPAFNDTALKSWATPEGEGALALAEPAAPPEVDGPVGLMVVILNSNRLSAEGEAPGDGSGCDPVM